MELAFKIVWQGFAAYLIGTVIFDLIHFALHAFAKSKIKCLKMLANMHMIHHRFFRPTLKINKSLITKNFFNHVLIEYSVHICSILLCLLFFHPLAVLGALIAETVIFLSVCYQRGLDVHHRPLTQLASARGGIFVSTEYHALHHIYPHSYYSSIIKVLDYLLGTGTQLKGKRISMTGARGALGRHMKVLLEKEGAQITTFQFGKDYTYDNYDQLKEPLTNTDILFLCHGSKYENAMQANCESFVRIIELFKSVRKRNLTPLEIWGVGSEIEAHPCFGIKKLKIYSDSKRSFAKYAHRYFHDREIQYRHLVHSAFMSTMGPGLMSARFAANVTVFLIKRGFKYVPVTYTGFAFVNYFRHFLKSPV